jgi:hypothetical protein
MTTAENNSTTENWTPIEDFTIAAITDIGACCTDFKFTFSCSLSFNSQIAVGGFGVGTVGFGWIVGFGRGKPWILERGKKGWRGGGGIHDCCCA